MRSVEQPSWSPGQDGAKMANRMNQDLLYVTPLSAVSNTATARGCSHLVTLINSDTPVETPACIRPGNHLRLAMNDICEPQQGLVHPCQDHVVELIDFALNRECEAPLLIHCWAGISRSTAAAFVTLCALNPDTEERAIARALRVASPTAYPNRLIVRLGDTALGRNGRMVEAVETIGRGRVALEGTVFSLPLRLAG